MASYLVQEEDGTSRFTLEDSSGFILLEQDTTTVTSTPSGGPGVLLREPALHLRPARAELTLTARRPQAKTHLTIITQTLRTQCNVFRPAMFTKPSVLPGQQGARDYLQRIEELFALDDLFD